ncbi:ABC transporter substrate-binding protein [Streptomyces apocyni]|uniref:ABC transporter substrate-binding protein n=1 Tax=Streptomyces apocyni TaxID=2654677 RepID=UPI0012EAF84D|nr:ABC transporter substrate-binding protein [Streptomyces apocyni]
MLTRWRNHVWGPLDKAIAAVVCLALLVGLGLLVVTLLPDECGEGLEEVGGECVGVTATDSLKGDPEIQSLITAIAEENASVKKAWETPEKGSPRIPYARIALMMPFTSDDTSTMTAEEMRRALAGAYTAQLEANAATGPHYQLLLANDGKDLDKWRPAVDRLIGMTDDESPLVGVLGMPSSTPETLKAVEALGEHRIPSVGPILTGTTMKDSYLFKTSPSNALLVDALVKYLAKEPGDRGFLVADNRQKDAYSLDLRDQFEDRFSDTYGLDKNRAYYLGITGEDAGIPRRFSSVAQKVCVTGSDTVFFAGRDRDLPYLIRHLVKEPACDNSKPLRILKVGIGLDTEHSKPELTQQMRDANITLVNAASVDPAWWEDKTHKERPEGLAHFLEQFEEVEKKHELGERPLDDGYSIMYRDSFTVLSEAFDQAYNEINAIDPDADTDTGTGTDTGTAPPVMPTTDDIYQTIINMGILDTEDGASCVSCVLGASGTFGFDDARETEQWPVCKPVPVMEYPPPPQPKGKADGKGGAKAPKLLRTYEHVFQGGCP